MRSSVNILISSLMFLLSLVFVITVSAEEQEELEVPLYVYEFPHISPELSGFFGLRYVDYSGSGKAGEYQYLQSSLSGGLRFVAFPFPHRLHIEIDVINKKDFFGDIRYAYKDIILFREIIEGLYHNLDNKELIDPGPSNQYTIDRKDINKKYGVSDYSSSMYVRVKTPDYPFHIFIDGQFFRKYGSMQEKYLSSYLPSNRVSMKRDIDWRSQYITLGTNSHLGPVEIEYSHQESKLSVQGDSRLENLYNGNLYPLSLIPQTKGTSDTLKIHSSYTGMVVASATFSDLRAENLDSGVKRKQIVMAGDLSLMLKPDLVVFLKYRYRDVDNDDLREIPVNYLGYPSYTNPINIKPSLDFKTDSLSGVVRYRPLTGVTFTGELRVEKTQRDNADYWRVPESTGKNTAALACNIKLSKGLNLRTRYIHQDIDAPQYNTQPDTSDEFRMNVSWIPYQWINTIIGYSVIRERRDRLQFYDNGLMIDVSDRDALREKFFASISFPLTESFTISPGFAYMRNKIVQDMIYDSDNINLQYNIDSDVISRDISRTYFLNLDYILKKDLMLNMEVSHTLSNGNLYHGKLIHDGLDVSDAEGDIRISETEFSIRSEYKFKNDFKIKASYTYINYDDRIYESNDSEADIIFVSLSKGW